MAGGVGSRFWPKSKHDSPKQFLDVLGTGETLIQQTFNRLKKVCAVENIFIVTNAKYKDLCHKQLPLVKNSNLLFEPAMRNTAPCIAYACFKIKSINAKANVIIAASDHIILKEQEFLRVAKECLKIASKKDILLTLGITPSRPESGYGYIQFTTENLEGNNKVKKVKTFTEKPDQELALNFLDSGDFLWNSGIFICNVKTISLAFRKYLRDMYDVFEEGDKFYNTPNEQNYINRVFSGCKNVSIDYGIMEKSQNVYVYPSSFGWSDLGTWSSLYNHLEKDANFNAVLGKNVTTYDSSNNIIIMPNNKLVVVHGLSGYILVENQDGTLLICKKEDEQKIKEFVNDLRGSGKKDFI